MNANNNIAKPSAALLSLCRKYLSRFSDVWTGREVCQMLQDEGLLLTVSPRGWVETGYVATRACEIFLGVDEVLNRPVRRYY